jgi:drug/metabolite transporter (DMT)-like permease
MIVYIQFFIVNEKEKIMNNTQKKYAPIALISAILSVSTAAIFIRFSQKSVPSITIAAYRLVLGSLILLPFMIKKAIAEWKELEGKAIGLIFISALLLALHFASWISSLEYTNVISSVVLVTTTPIWVAAISPWLLGEKVPKKFLIGLIVAFLGITLLNITGVSSQVSNEFEKSSNGQNMAIIGNSLALVGAFCAAGYVVIGRILRKQLSTEAYVLGVYSISGLILTSFAIFAVENSIVTNLSDLKWLFLMALIPQAIGHSLLNWSLGILPAYYVAISLLGEPIGSSILAIFFLKETPSLKEVISSVVILVGIIIAITKPNKQVNIDQSE